MSALEELETALVTGASSGIGEAFARQLAARGKDLILVARSKERLYALAEEVATRHGVQTHVIVADLARPLAAASTFEETQRLGWPVDLLVNNAGFAKVGRFVELPFDTQADMVRLNINCLMELTRFYLPAMRRRQRGGVINVASNAAFQPVPYMAVYAATKAFVLHFSEGLAEETRADGLRVLALCPGATATGFWAVAGAFENRLDMMTPPDTVVAVALCAFERGTSVVVPGLHYKLLAFAASRLAPRWLVRRIAGHLFRGIAGHSLGQGTH
jgi:short-subunit dehydrogenase